MIELPYCGLCGKQIVNAPAIGWYCPTLDCDGEWPEKSNITFDYKTDAARITELENALNVWTSVEDRLPEDGFSHCLFYSKSEDICAVGGMHKGVLQVNDEDVFHNNVTHWMPLPEPPAIAKGEKE